MGNKTLYRGKNIFSLRLHDVKFENFQITKIFQSAAKAW